MGMGIARMEALWIGSFVLGTSLFSIFTFGLSRHLYFQTLIESIASMYFRIKRSIVFNSLSGQTPPYTKTKLPTSSLVMYHETWQHLTSSPNNINPIRKIRIRLLTANNPSLSKQGCSRSYRPWKDPYTNHSTFARWQTLFSVIRDG